MTKTEIRNPLPFIPAKRVGHVCVRRQQLNSRNDRVVAIEDIERAKADSRIRDVIRYKICTEYDEGKTSFENIDEPWALFIGDVRGFCEGIRVGACGVRQAWIGRVVDPKHFDSQLAPDVIVYATLSQLALDLTEHPAVISTICRETHQYRDEELPFNPEAMRFAERQVYRWRQSKLDPIASHASSYLCRECQWKELCHG